MEPFVTFRGITHFLVKKPFDVVMQSKRRCACLLCMFAQLVVLRALLMFAWKMTRPVNLFTLYSGLPLVGLGSFAVQTSINEDQQKSLDCRANSFNRSERFSNRLTRT